MDVFEVEISMRGYHIYMQESFHRRTKEEANEQDPYAVAIVKKTTGCRIKVVGHIPCKENIGSIIGISAALGEYGHIGSINSGSIRRILAAYYIKQT